MHSLKNFVRLSSKSERCLHLSTKSSLWINSCWELRNKARKLDLVEKNQRSSSFDRLFYKPRPISQRSYSRTWLNKIGKHVISVNIFKMTKCISEPDSATDSMIAQQKNQTQHRPIYKSIPKYEPVCVDYEPQGKQGIRPVKNISAKDIRSLGTSKSVEDQSLSTYSTARKIQTELRKRCPKCSYGSKTIKKMRMPLSLYLVGTVDPLIKIRSKRYSHRNNYSNICPSPFSLERSTF